MEKLGGRRGLSFSSLPSGTEHTGVERRLFWRWGWQGRFWLCWFVGSRYVVCAEVRCSVLADWLLLSLFESFGTFTPSPFGYCCFDFFF